MDNKPLSDQDEPGDGRRTGDDRRSSAYERRRGSNRVLEIIVSSSQIARDRRQDKRRTGDSPGNGWAFWRKSHKNLTG